MTGFEFTDAAVEAAATADQWAAERAFVRSILASRELPQASLAEAVGITQKHLSQILNGHDDGTVQLWSRIAAALETALKVSQPADEFEPELEHGCHNHQVTATDGDGEPLAWQHCGICGSRSVGDGWLAGEVPQDKLLGELIKEDRQKKAIPQPAPVLDREAVDQILRDHDGYTPMGHHTRKAVTDAILALVVTSEASPPDAQVPQPTPVVEGPAEPDWARRDPKPGSEDEPDATWSQGARDCVEIALRAADAGEAGHWPTVAGWLAAEVRRLRAGGQDD